MKTAILLIGFNRVDYFDQTLSSLEQNTSAHECDLHIYLDGGPHANHPDLKKRIQASTFTNITLVARTENWGIGRHLIDARRALFDEQGYDRVLLFEDDMVLAPTYVQTVLNIMDWSQQYNDIGTVMAYTINEDPLEQQQQQLDQIIPTNRHFWGYGMDRAVWDEIKATLYDFEDRYLNNVSYAYRAHRSIRWGLIRKISRQPRNIRTGAPLIPQTLLTSPFKRFPFGCPTSQDAITALALWRHGFARITTRVSRARYVGEKGFSFTPEIYEKMGFGNQQTLEFSSLTSSPTSFELMKTNLQGQSFKPTHYE